MAKRSVPFGAPGSEHLVACSADIRAGPEPMGRPIGQWSKDECQPLYSQHAFMNTTLTIHLEVDTQGLKCPLPLLRLKKALNTLESGQVVRVTATDPASVLDFGVFVERTGHLMLEQYEETGLLIYLIRKG